MENFLLAYQARELDTEVLINANRKVGAVHLGGCTVECLLKGIIVRRNGIDEWEEDKDGRKHGIKRPSHILIKGLEHVPELLRRLDQSQHLKDCLEILQNPKVDFIDMRYDGEEIDEDRYKEWKKAYHTFILWLKQQMMQLQQPKSRKRGNCK
ncbi:hypothetical protein JJB07_23510 [Tumebacillus sp. ITR2]|uniref:Uncharacterized protein n=1 Tax=Tumebacillus amylolyticus TaxID=2801339 RepID=A0ABS1JGX9_9BACL|nr:hypothetical protein [Tumebacillus amylolyticus]MBL0389502.1 hypothetical protein [Tumebacillus amylolyticus]